MPTNALALQEIAAFSAPITGCTLKATGERIPLHCCIACTCHHHVGVPKGEGSPLEDASSFAARVLGFGNFSATTGSSSTTNSSSSSQTNKRKHSDHHQHQSSNDKKRLKGGGNDRKKDDRSTRPWAKDDDRGNARYGYGFVRRNTETERWRKSDGNRRSQDTEPRRSTTTDQHRKSSGRDEEESQAGDTTTQEEKNLFFKLFQKFAKAGGGSMPF